MSDMKKNKSTASTHLRTTVTEADREHVRDILVSSGFFYDYEVDVAVELVDEALKKGQKESGYHFLFLEQDGKTVGYTCYGPIACTVGSIDLYWIGVHERCRGQGLGKVLLSETEKLVTAIEGRRVYIETSARPQYDPTREFYLKCGYKIETILEEFYGPGDGKVIYSKVLPR